MTAPRQSAIERASDPYTADCVECRRDPCIAGRDFCQDCIDAGAPEDNFGRCYQCSDYHDHEHCVGVPCQCPCPTPDQRERERLRESAKAKLTFEERRELGLL